jgi:hypothetical protein
MFVSSISLLVVRRQEYFSCYVTASFSDDLLKILSEVEIPNMLKQFAVTIRSEL